MQTLTLIISVLSLAGGILPIFRKSYWWLRVFDYPKLHTAILSIISIILLLLFWGLYSIIPISLIITLIGSLIYNVPKILKYTPLASINAKACQKPKDDSCFRIIQANIRMENRLKSLKNLL
jgi:endonuclease/exonuclease/phosphatase (EEP) superfamily protein YafD